MSADPSIFGYRLMLILSWISQLCIKRFQNLDMILGSPSETTESDVPYRRKIWWKKQLATSSAVSLYLEGTSLIRFENLIYEGGDAVVLILCQGKMCDEIHSYRIPSSGREFERLKISIWFLSSILGPLVCITSTAIFSDIWGLILPIEIAQSRERFTVAKVSRRFVIIARCSISGHFFGEHRLSHHSAEHPCVLKKMWLVVVLSLSL